MCKLRTALAVLCVVTLLCSIVPLSSVFALEEPEWTVYDSGRGNIRWNIDTALGGTGRTYLTTDSIYTEWSSKYPQWETPRVISTDENGALLSIARDDIGIQAQIPHQNGNGNPGLFEFDFTLYSEQGNYDHGDKPVVFAISHYGICADGNYSKVVTNSHYGIGFSIDTKNKTLSVVLPGASNSVNSNSKSEKSWGTVTKIMDEFTFDKKHNFVIAQTGWNGDERIMSVYVDDVKVYEYNIAAADKDNSQKNFASSNQKIAVAMDGGWCLQDAKVLIDLTPTTIKQRLVSLAEEYKPYVNTSEPLEAEVALSDAINAAVVASSTVSGNVDYVATLNSLRDAKIEYDEQMGDVIDKIALQNDIDIAKQTLEAHGETAMGYMELIQLIEEAELLLSTEGATAADGFLMQSQLKNGIEKCHISGNLVITEPTFDADGKEQEICACDTCDYVISEKVILKLILGDANRDSSVNSLDLVEARGILLGEDCENYQELSLDVHADGLIDVRDLVGLKKILVSIENQINSLGAEQASFYAETYGNSQNGEKFLYFTDPHYITAEATGTWKDNANTHFQVMKNCYKKAGVTFAISGGDWLNDSNTKANALEMLGAVKTKMDANFSKSYLLVGNHDYSFQKRVGNSTVYNDYKLTPEEIAGAWQYDKTYYSFEGENTKFYAFDSGIDWSHSELDDYDIEQIAWFLDELFKNNDTHIALMIHQFYRTGTEVFVATDMIAQIGQAYNKRESFEFKGITYDFSNKTGNVEYIMSGHSHKDENGVLHDIPYVLVESAKEGSSIAPVFDLVYVDYDAGKINTVRVGGGSNRTIDLW